MTVRQIANRNSVHSNWSKLIPINNGINNASTTNTEAKKGEAQIFKKEGNKEHCSSSI